MKYQTHECLYGLGFCDQLIKYATPRVTKAKVGPTNKRVLAPNARNAANVKVTDNDINRILVTGAIKAANDLSGEIPEGRFVESTEIVVYPPGGLFRKHHDGDHRSHSIITFLNAGYSGGELVFDDISFSGMPACASLIWENTPDAWHCCQPVTCGLKWIAITWLKNA